MKSDWTQMALSNILKGPAGGGIPEILGAPTANLSTVEANKYDFS